MTDRPNQSLLHRRKFLLGVAGGGAALAAGVLVRAAPQAAGAAQSGATAAASWTPPTIPKPLPTEGGVPPTVVGAAPTKAAAGAAVSGQSQNQVEQPGQPAVPAGSPAAAATPAATPAATVTLTPDFKFDPAQVTINKGETILWKNEGRSPQTVTDDPARAADKANAVLPNGAKPWDSGVLNYGETYTHTFDVPGDYVYFSMAKEKAGMVGKITVNG